jgi:hypothetical protein
MPIDPEQWAVKTRAELLELAIAPENQAEAKLALRELELRQIDASLAASKASEGAAFWTKLSALAIAASVVVMAAGVILDLCQP